MDSDEVSSEPGELHAGVETRRLGRDTGHLIVNSGELDLSTNSAFTTSITSTKPKTKAREARSSNDQDGHERLSGDKQKRSRQGSLRKAALLSSGKQRSNTQQLAELELPEDEQAAVSIDVDTTVFPSSSDSDEYSKTSPISVGKDLSYELLDAESSGNVSRAADPRSTMKRSQKRAENLMLDEIELVGDQSGLHPGLAASGNTGHSRDRYFLHDDPLLRKRSGRSRSPLVTIPIDPFPIQTDWDYSDTEWWGWIILIITWIVFVIGMGSCFEVWSWAWAVGKTPYAPPELEDDETLPIVGYYPALIILTGVMAWIWVFVAWVGMKYFRHAKIS